MSFWDEAQQCLEQLIASGLVGMGDRERYIALQQVNLLHTDTDVMAAMKTFYRHVVAVEDCKSKLFDPANAVLHDKGVIAEVSADFGGVSVRVGVRTR